MPQLKRSSVDRSGVTARYWTHETNTVSYTATKDLKLRFSIASKGGGHTDIQLSIPPQDLCLIILSIAKAMPSDLAVALANATHVAIAETLLEKPESGA